MTITRHTAADLYFLLLAALICGLLISFIYEILRAAPSIVFTCKYSSFPKYEHFIDDMLARDIGKVTSVIADVILCLLFAAGVLIVSFICNSGNFRLSAPAAMLIGYLSGACIFGKLIKRAVFILLYLLKWVFDIMLFPIVRLGRLIAYCCSRVYKKAMRTRNKRLIERYTAQRISQIDQTTEFGLIEKYYKEVLK